VRLGLSRRFLEAAHGVRLGLSRRAIIRVSEKPTTSHTHHIRETYHISTSHPRNLPHRIHITSEKPTTSQHHIREIYHIALKMASNPFRNMPINSAPPPIVIGAFGVRYNRRNGESPSKTLERQDSAIVRMPWTRPFKFGATKPKAPNRVRKNALINKVEAAIARHQARQRKAAEEAAKQEGVELQDEVNPGAESRLSEWEDITENPFLQDPPSNPFQEQRSRTNMEARQNTANGWERCRPFLVNTFQSGRKACCNGVQAFSRKFEVLLVSFHEAKRVELDSCACLCGAATTLLQMGYFPSAPTHPTSAKRT
jgi:hypothetical protein